MMVDEEKKERRRQQLKAARAKWDAKNRKEYMRRYRLTHGDKERARARELRAVNPEQAHARDRVKRLADPEGARRRTKAWQEKNKEYRRAYQISYAKTNPEKRKASYKNCIARRRGAVGRYTADDVRRILMAQRERCAYCRQKLGEHHIDHIVPLSRGGTNWPANIQITCPTCNVRKHARLPEVFARELGMLI
jgi:5-methylcytosine-specific restriction endonuclease McrA